MSATIEREPTMPMISWRPTLRARNIVIALAIAVAVPMLLGQLGIASVWFFIVSVGLTYAMMALSLNLLMGYAGQISLGHGGLLAIGAYASGIVTGRWDLPFVVGLMLAASLGSVVALVIGLPALRLRGLYLAITTIGFMVAMERSILQISWLSRGSAGMALPRPELGGLVASEQYAYLAVVAVLLVLFWVVDGNVRGSSLGRAFLGLRDDEEVAASYGVDIAGHKLQAFVLSGAMAGIAGAANGHLVGFVNSATFNLNFSLGVVTWVIIGGLASRSGVVTAAILFGITPKLLEEVFRSEAINDYSLVFGAVVLLFTIASNPNGFAGAIRHAREEKAAKAAKAAAEAGEVDLDLDALPALPVPTKLMADAPRRGERVLDVRDVTVRFGGLTAVDGASLDVNAGEIVGLIGPNGAGKTTLFNAITGVVDNQAGAISLRGTALDTMASHDRAAAGLGRTFQRTGLAMDLTVRENLLLAQHSLVTHDALDAVLRTRKVVTTEAALAATADHVIEELGFPRLADLPVRYLSGGQKRIVEIACTLVTAPELLMLDEPTAGMAPAAVENLAERLRELRDEHGRTILIIEHHLPLVLDLCDRVVVLDHGKIIATGTPDEIMQHPHVLRAYLGERAADDLDELRTNDADVEVPA